MGLFRGFMNRLLQIIVANLILGIGLFERLTYDRPVLGCNMCRGLKTAYSDSVFISGNNRPKTFTRLRQANLICPGPSEICPAPFLLDWGSAFS